MKKLRVIFFGILGLLLIYVGCYFFLNRYVYTDQELAEYYKDKKMKPQFKQTAFLNHHMHYAIISKSDTLPLLVFVHGAPGAWYGYMVMMNDSLLQQKFKMISVDRLGYGKSDYGRAELSVQMQALAIKTVIDRENTSGKKVYLLGRSYGAPIAGWLAIHYPRHIGKLFMISPVIDPGKEKFYWFSNIGTCKCVQWILPDFLNVATAEKFSHPTQMKMLLPEWEQLQVPTTVIVGENDHIADTANFSFAKKHITHAGATFLKVNAGHLVTSDQPKLVEKLLLEKP